MKKSIVKKAPYVEPVDIRTLEEKILETINWNIKNYEARFVKRMARLQENFSYEFAWCGEDVFKAHRALRQLNYFVVVNEENFTTEDRVRMFIKYAEDRIWNGELRARSTGELACVASTWEIEVDRQLARELKRVIEAHEAKFGGHLNVF